MDGSCTCTPGEISDIIASTGSVFPGPGSAIDTKETAPKNHHQDQHHSHNHHHHHEHTRNHHNENHLQKGHQQQHKDTRVTHSTTATATKSNHTTAASFKAFHKDAHHSKHTPARKSYTSPSSSTSPYNSSLDPDFADWNHRSVGVSAVIGTEANTENNKHTAYNDQVSAPHTAHTSVHTPRKK